MYRFKLQFESLEQKEWLESGLFPERNCINVYEYLHDVSIISHGCNPHLNYRLFMFDPHHEFWMSLGIGTINDILGMFGFQTRPDFEQGLLCNSKLAILPCTNSTYSSVKICPNH